MAVTYHWKRQAPAIAINANGTVSFPMSALGVDNWTLQRVIFGFRLFQHTTEENPFALPPHPLPIYGGLILSENVPIANGPQTAPNLDWLWAGLFVPQIIIDGGYTSAFWASGYWSGPEQLQTDTSRKLTDGAATRMQLVFDRLPNSDADNIDWAFFSRAYLSMLYSTPA